MLYIIRCDDLRCAEVFAFSIFRNQDVIAALEFYLRVAPKGKDFPHIIILSYRHDKFYFVHDCIFLLPPPSLYLRAYALRRNSSDRGGLRRRITSHDVILFDKLQLVG